MNRGQWVSAWVAFGIGAFGSVGCSSKPPAMVPGKGVVLKRDGTPLSGARVEFFPAAVADRPKLKGTPWSLTGKDGEFELVIFKETGLPPGKYKIIVWEIPLNKDSAV